MSITLEQIVNLQHKNLNTLPRKIIWLMVRNQADVFGWSTISSADFCLATGLPRRSVEGVLKFLIKEGMVERERTSVAGPRFSFRVLPLAGGVAA